MIVPRNNHSRHTIQNGNVSTNRKSKVCIVWCVWRLMVINYLVNTSFSFGKKKKKGFREGKVSGELTIYVCTVTHRGDVAP